MVPYKSLLKEIQDCTICSNHLPHNPRPVLQFHPKADILIAGQAPGKKVHQSGIPFDDASGKRLRNWLGTSIEVFYNPEQIAILPMGFCYPGRGKSGDLSPRPECAIAWREKLLVKLPKLKTIILIGQYAIDYHLEDSDLSLTEIVKQWEKYLPDFVPLPHPSPRNNIWLNKNPWFETDVLPFLRKYISEILTI